MGIPKIADHKNDPKSYRSAKRLRRDSSSVEQILWHELRLASKISGIRFRRQHPIQPYIVDFICLRARLVIEIDGASHDTRLDYDKKREVYLKEQGYEVVRFTNEDVVTNCMGVVEAILNRADELLLMATA